MFKPAARLFANLAVGKKLFIGFGLVLLLTAAMTVSGYLAVQAVLKGHEQVGQLAQVNQEILQARRLERSFAIEQTQENAARVRDSLLKVQSMLEQLGKQVAESSRVQTMQQATTDWRSGATIRRVISSAAHSPSTTAAKPMMPSITSARSLSPSMPCSAAAWAASARSTTERARSIMACSVAWFCSRSCW